MAIPGFPSLNENLQPIDQFPEKWYPILDPNSLIYIPYPRINSLKTILFTAAHTHIAHIWQYPSPPGIEPHGYGHKRIRAKIPHFHGCIRNMEVWISWSLAFFGTKKIKGWWRFEWSVKGAIWGAIISLWTKSNRRPKEREREAKTYAFFVLVQVRNTTSRGL